MTVEPILFDTYQAVIKNSIDSRMFTNAYALVDNEKKDIVENGELSCAFFVSTTLLIFKLVKEMHVTVRGTERDMLASGWIKIEQPRPGSVLIWGDNSTDGKAENPHIGFCTGKDTAVSNSSKQKKITEHPLQSGRVLESIYWHPRLDI